MGSSLASGAGFPVAKVLNETCPLPAAWSQVVSPAPGCLLSAATCGARAVCSPIAIPAALPARAQEHLPSGGV